MLEIVPQIDYDNLAVEFTPESHRTPRFIAWMQAMQGQTKWLNKNFWNYCYGDIISDIWSIAVTYTTNDIVLTYNGVYSSTAKLNFQNNPDLTPIYSSSNTYSTGNSVTFGLNEVGEPNYYQANQDISSPEVFTLSHWNLLDEPVWYKIAPSYIGAQERAQYNAQKLIMEYALNRWFRTEFRQPTVFQDGTITSPYGLFYLPTSDIFISTEAVVNITFVSGETESLSSYSGEKDSGVWFSTETVVTGTDTSYRFVVWIPTSLSLVLGSSYVQIVSKVVNLMRIEGTAFTIRIY